MMGRKTTLALLNMVLGAVLGIVALKLTSEYFGPAYTGQVTYALSLLGLLFFITDLGMSSAHIKRVSEGRDPGDCFATFAVFKVVATLVFVALSLALVLGYTLVLHKPLESTTLPVLLVCLVYYVAKALQDIGQSSFDARLETARSQTAALTDTVIRVGLTAVFALVVAGVVHGTGPLAAKSDAGGAWAWVRENPGATLAIATAAGGLAAATTSLVLLWRIAERGRFRWEVLRDYWTFALPLFITIAVGVIALNIDGATLGFFLSDADAGIFGNVRRVPQVLGGIGIAVGTLLFPTISAMAAKGDRDGVQTSMDQTMRYLSMLLVPIVAFLVFFAEAIIRIVLSEPFLPGANPMRVLAVYVLLQAFATAHGTLLMGTNHVGYAAKMAAISAIMVVALDLVLVPNDIRTLGIPLAGLGVLGASLATLASGTFYYVSLRIGTARKVGYREHGRALRHVAAALVMGGALWLLDATILPLTRWYVLILYTFVGMLVYVAGLVVLREFGREQWDLLRGSLDPRAMLRYVRSELTEKRRE